MFGHRRILLATTNLAKQVRLGELLEGLSVDVALPSNGSYPRIDEGGQSFRENAIRKACAWSAWSGGLALASDGGIEIPALGREWQSLLTRRATGEAVEDSEISDTDRIARLLSLTSQLKGPDRHVFWTEAIALAERGRIVGAWKASSGEAMLASEPCPASGAPGFWVDRLRYYPSLARYHAELSGEERVLVGDPWSQLRALVQEAILVYLSDW